MKSVKAKFGEAYKTAGLALAPSTAYMYAPLDICANYALALEWGIHIGSTGTGRRANHLSPPWKSGGYEKSLEPARLNGSLLLNPGRIPPG